MTLTPATGKTSELAAVNSILRAAGEAPVGNLTDEAGVDSETALSTLREAALQMQSVGWSFNTRCYDFVPLGDGTYPVPDTILRIDPNDHGVTRYTTRGGLLFDMDEGTHVVGTNTIRLEVVEFLSWDDLPEPARLYAMRAAARVFVDENLGDSSASQTVRTAEQAAWIALRRHELATGNYRVFGPEAQRVVDRPRPIRNY